MGGVTSKINCAPLKRPSQPSKRSSNASNGAAVPDTRPGSTPASAEAVQPLPVVSAVGEELTFQLPGTDEPLGLRLSEENVVLDLKPDGAGAKAGVRVSDIVKSVDGVICDFEYAALDQLKKKPEPTSSGDLPLRSMVVWRAAAGVEEVQQLTEL